MKLSRQGLRYLVALAATLAFALPAAAGTVTYPQDVTMALTSDSLTILAGSSCDNLVVNANDFVPTISGTDKLTVRQTPVAGNPKSFTDGTSFYCTYSGGTNTYSFTSAHSGKTISVSATDCSAPPSGGGGGGAGGYTAPFGTLSAPNGGQVLNAGSQYQILWSAGGTGVTGIKLSLSTDSGLTYPTVIVASASNSSYYYWTVPDINTTKARVKMEVLGTTVTDASDADFTIVGTAPPAAEQPTGEEAPAEEGAPTGEQPASETPTEDAAIAAAEAAAPAVDSNSSGSYSPTEAADNTPTINVDKELEEPPEDKPALCASGSLIKGSQAAVYFCGKDGKRYVFVNEKAFKTWYSDFSAVKTIADSVLAQIPIGGNITYKPGVRMIKIQTDPKVYAIARGGLLRWVETEKVAAALYGADWNKKIDDVSDAFFVNYKIGPPITEADLGL